MNRKHVLALSILFLVSLTLSSCSEQPVLGIDRPIVVKDIDFLFSEVETMESLTFGSQINKPKAPYNMIIVIKAKTDHSDPQSVCDWGSKVMLEYSRNGKVEKNSWDICGSTIIQDTKLIRFYFVTYKNGVADYQIVFPDGQKVPLKELIDTRTGEGL